MIHRLKPWGFAVAILIATVTVSAAAADNKLAAKVNFAFRTPQTELPAGEYTVSSEQRNGLAVFRLTNVESGKSVFVIAASPISPFRNPSGDPRLVFQCVPENCALAEVWTGFGAGGHRVPVPSLRAEEARIATVRMEPAGRR